MFRFLRILLTELNFRHYPPSLLGWWSLLVCLEPYAHRRFTFATRQNHTHISGFIPCSCLLPLRLSIAMTVGGSLQFSARHLSVKLELFTLSPSRQRAPHSQGPPRNLKCPPRLQTARNGSTQVSNKCWTAF